MADFKLGRLKFVWKGGWTTATAYVKDDIVEYNGQGWVCETPHTSAGFPADRDSGKWTKMAEGFSWKGPWQVGTTYQKNAVVSHLSSTWISIADNNTGNAPLTLPATVHPNWQLYAAGYDLSYVDQDILPSADATYDLGSNSLRFKDIHLSGSSIYLGDAKIESDATSVTITNGDGSQVIFENGGFAGGAVVFQGNTVTTVDSNSNLELDAAGTGKIVALTNMDIQGDLDVTGDITLGGNLIIGDAPIDTVTVQADFTSDLIPNASNSFDLGSTGQRWDNLYINKINDLLFDRVEGKTYYVTEDGDDLEPGTSIQGAFATVKKALTVAVAGDTVKVGAGTFTEVFPLTVPAGVSIVGLGIRPTKIKPTVGTNNKDAFLLEGETGIVDLTVADFFYDSINDTGYAFRFKSGAVITTRSPYIERVTVLCKGSSPTLSDPYGYLTGDAGRGAEVDGAKVTRASLEAAMLFNECTFVVPNSRALIMKNGARVEWLTCFTYFADLAIEGAVGATGRGGDGKTYLSLSNVSGTWNVGNTLSYYADDGVTVLASGVIEAISGGRYQLDGSVSGFITNTNRANKPVTVNGDAKLSNLQQRFGATSLLLDGTGDYISLASDADFGYGTGDFTIEFFVRLNAIGALQVLFDQRTAASEAAIYLEASAAGNVRLYVNGAYQITSSNTISATTWTHVAVARQSGTTRLFVGGTLTPTTYSDSNNYAARPIKLGTRYLGDTQFVAGYFDEVRITKGLARYTSTFTPTATAFSGDSSTVLLLHFDGANLSTNIVDDGITIQDVRSSAGGTATGITRYDRKEFAAELRSISSANIYGNQGAKADGADVKLQLMAHNFAYIGTGADLTNDDTAVVQANEVIEVNGGKVYYNSVDQSGNFRVGEYFSVDFETGAVTFAAGNFDVSSLVGINFTDGVNTTIIDPTQVTTGNLTLAGNTLSSSTGDITIDPSGAQDIILNADVNISGNLDVGGNITLAGNITIGDQTLDTVTVVADFTSNLIPDADQTYDLGASAKQWRTIHVDQLDNGQVSIKDNRIRTTQSNTNIEIDTAGTGTIELQSDTNVTGTFSVSSNTVLTGDLEVRGGDLTTNQTTFNLLNATATTLNIGGAATTVDIGAASGTTSINNNVDIDLDLNVDGGNLTTNQTTFSLLNTNATTVNFAGAATTLFIGESTGTTTVRNNLAVNGNTTITGNLTVNGTTTSINSSTIQVDDKNLELASVASVVGITGNITSSATTSTVTGLSTTTGLIPGQTVTQTGGTGAFGTGTTIASIDSSTQITVTASTSNTAGSITFTAGGATDVTANGGGITVKGTTDKTFQYDNANIAWTSSESMNLAALEAYMINGVDKLTETELFPNEATATIGAATSVVTVADQLVITNDLTTDGDILTTQTVMDMYPITLNTLTIAASADSVTIGGPTGKVSLANNADIVGSNLRVGLVSDVGAINVLPNVQTITALTVGAPSTTLSGTALTLEADVEYGTGIVRDVRILTAGNYYIAGETVTISGTQLAGTSPANDITITIVGAVTPMTPGVSGGEVTAISWTGIAPISNIPTTFNLINNTATTINFGGQATQIYVGAVNTLGQPNGFTTIRNNAQINGDLVVNNLFTGGNGNLTTNALTMNVFNTTATTINAFGAADNIIFGKAGGTIEMRGEILAGDVIGNFKGSFFGDNSSVIINGINGDITANDLQVDGQAVFAFDVEIQGGDLVTNQTTFNLINDTATTLNIGQAATSIVMGATTGTMQLRNSNVQVDGDLAVNGGDITTSASVFNFVGSGATELNMGASATIVNIGSSLGTTTINNNLTVGENLTVEGGTLDTTNVNFNLLPDTATTVSAFAAATVIDIGEATGTTTIKSAVTNIDGDLVVKGGDLTTNQTTFNLINDTATTVNFAGAASAIVIGAGTGTTTIRQDVVIEDDLTIDGGDLKTSALTFNILPANATTINLGAVATQVNIGSSNGSTNVQHSLNVAGVLTLGSADSTVARIDSADTSFYLTNTFVENLYMGGAATTVEIGAVTGTTSINNDLSVDGQVTFEQDLSIKGGDLTTNQSTFNLLDTTATTINFGGAATTIDIGSASGTTSVKNALQVVGDLEVQGGDITTNQSTFNLVDSNATTVNFAGGASAVNIGAASSTVTIEDALTVNGATTVGGHVLPDTTEAYDLGSATNRFRDLYLSGATINLAGGTISFDGDKFNFQGGTNVGSSVETESTSFDLLNTVAQTINFGGEAFTVNIGSVLGGQTNIKHAANVFGILTVGAADSGVSRIDVADATAYLADTTASTVYLAGAATTVNIGSSVGTTTVNHSLTVDGNAEINQDLTVNGNLTLTSLNTSGENNDFIISPQGTGQVIIEPQGGLVINPDTTGNINNTNIGGTVRGTGAFTTLAANGQTNFTGGISSVDSTTGTVVVTGGLAVSENVNIEGNLSANALTLRGTVLFDNELAVPSGGTGAGQFNERGILYGNSTAPLQSTAGSDYQNPYTGTNQQTSNAILTTTAAGVPVWTDVIDCGTY